MKPHANTSVSNPAAGIPPPDSATHVPESATRFSESATPGSAWVSGQDRQRVMRLGRRRTRGAKGGAKGGVKGGAEEVSTSSHAV
eukprot:364705-Chlamydomonas_euryale.AAC.20